MSDNLPERRRDALVGERLVAVEVQTRNLTSEVGKVRERVHDMANSVGILTGTVEHATETQREEHHRMQQALARQDVDRAAMHLESRGAIDALHGRVTGMLWWLIGAQGALLAIIAGLWFAGAKG